MANSGDHQNRVLVFIGALCLLSAPILVSAFLQVLSQSFDIKWLILTILILVTVPAFVVLPNVSSLITIGDAFVISICMMYGTEPAILANTLWISCFTLLWRYKQRGQPDRTPVYKILFNISSGVINVALYGHVYRYLSSLGSDPIYNLLIPTFAVAATFYLSNSIFVATAISLSTGVSLFHVWQSNYLTVSLDYVLSACAAAFIKLMEGLHILAPILVAPFVGAVWLINRVYKAKVVEAERHLKEQEALYMRTVESLALAVDAKDQTTYGHIRRVRAYALRLAEKCGITDPSELQAIETGSLLHDIGKLAIDDYILNKPGKLTRQEFEKMKLHTEAGHEILEQIQFPFPVARLVRAHHERWDGLGYPDGLRGSNIPLGARILSVADAFDTIRSSRPYKRPCSTEEAVGLLRAQSGVLFDPGLVEMFVNNIGEMEGAAAEASRQMTELSFRKYFETVNEELTKPDLPELPRSRPSEEVATELVSLAEFAMTFGRRLELADVLGVVARRIPRLLPAATCAVCLDDGDGTVRAAHVHGKLSSLLQDAKVEQGKGISGWVVAYKRPVLNTDPALELGDRGREVGTLSDTLAVPLFYQDDCIGALLLFAAPPASYSKPDLLLMETVAALIGPLIGECRERRGIHSEARIVDVSTRAYDPGYLAVAGAQMLAMAAKTQSPFSLLLVDIRNFAQIARLCGSPSTENMASRIAAILRSDLRDTDVLVRYGFQSLVVMLPGLRSEQTARYVQRLRRQINSAGFTDLLGHSLTVVCDMGIATYPADGGDIVALLGAAHRSIEESAKAAARQNSESDNRIVEFPPRS